MEIVVPGSAPERKNTKMDQRHEEHRNPGAIFGQGGKIQPGIGFLLWRRLNPLPGRQESDKEQDYAQNCPYSQRHPPAVLYVVANGELGNQRQGKAADDKLSGIDGDEAIGI